MSHDRSIHSASDRLFLVLCTLNATGSFYLINPQGALIGRSGVVDTGGRFVASALDIDSNAFMVGRPLTAKGSAQGRVAHLGRISSQWLPSRMRQEPAAV